MPGGLCCRVDNEGWPWFVTVCVLAGCPTGHTFVRPSANSSMFACECLSPCCCLLRLCARLCAALQLPFGGFYGLTGFACCLGTVSWALFTDGGVRCALAGRGCLLMCLTTCLVMRSI
jgi:hypothetical protein